MLFPARSLADLNECTSFALRRGFFKNQLLVDASGRSVMVQSATKLHGIGPFWGYNIFLNQRIRVQLVAQAAASLSLEAVRTKTLKALEGRQQWDAGADIDELREKISGAHSIRDIATLVTHAYFRR